MTDTTKPTEFSATLPPAWATRHGLATLATPITVKYSADPDLPVVLVPARDGARAIGSLYYLTKLGVSYLEALAFGAGLDQDASEAWFLGLGLAGRSDGLHEWMVAQLPELGLGTDEEFARGDYTVRLPETWTVPESEQVRFLLTGRYRVWPGNREMTTRSMVHLGGPGVGRAVVVTHKSADPRRLAALSRWLERAHPVFSAMACEDNPRCRNPEDAGEVAA